MTGMDRFMGSWKWGKELRKNILKESGLPISMGMSVNKMVSKVAAGEAKPNGQRHIAGQAVEGFLAPMHIRKLPSVGLKLGNSLAQMGVRQVITLRQIPQEVLEHIYGKHGRTLWQKAWGIDHSPIVPHRDRKSISTEQTFQVDTIDLLQLKATLTKMAGQLGHRLRTENQLCSCITVKLRYANFDTQTRQTNISLTAQDDVLIQKALQLFDKLYDRRLRIRLVGVKLSKLVHGNYQFSLLEDTPQQIALHHAVDYLKRKFGAGVIERGSGLWKPSG